MSPSNEWPRRCLLLSAVLPVLVGCGGRGGEESGRRPNVLLISIDSLRSDHLGCYGYDRPTSPVIDALAAEGALFTNVASSTSWTLPAHASMFTGQPSTIHGCSSRNQRLGSEQVTLAETLTDAGYATAGFWSGPYLHPIFGLGQGFEDYVNCASFDYFRKRARKKHSLSHDQSHGDITSPRILAAVDAWLGERSEEGDERPFFLFVHMWDVHYDYIPPAPYDTLFDPDYTGDVDGRDPADLPSDLPAADLEHLIALYDGEIAWTDKHVGDLLALLDAQDLMDDTIVLLTADHGEEFFEHGRFGHRAQLFEESISVPLIVYSPERIRAGVVVDSQVSVADIPATILDMLGAPPLWEVLGESLLPLAMESAGREGSFVVSELYRVRREAFDVAIFQGPWKIQVRRESRDLIGVWNLRDDPGEESNLAAEGQTPPEVQELLESTFTRLDELARSSREQLGAASGSTGPTEPVELPSDVIDSLEALGYIDGEE